MKRVEIGINCGVKEKNYLSLTINSKRVAMIDVAASLTAKFVRIHLSAFKDETFRLFPPPPPPAGRGEK